MGYNFASDLATTDIDLRSALSIHLTANHYPPVPTSMIEPCINAIDAFLEWDYDRMIDLPEGVLWRNQTSAPAHAIVEGHHLDAFIDECEVFDE